MGSARVRPSKPNSTAYITSTVTLVRNPGYGLRRMRWRGLAKAAIQVRLTAIAYNLKRTLCIVTGAA